MPTRMTAKTIAENALTTIGAFPASMSQADAGELRKSLKWLEMMLNSVSGTRIVSSFQRVVDIPIEAGVGDYLLEDYEDAAGTQDIFSVTLIDQDGNPEPLDIMWDGQIVEENLTDTGTPLRAIVASNNSPELKVFPTPTQDDEDNGLILRVRIQTYHDAIDHTGTGDSDLSIRPSWYLWATKKLSYEIGCGPVRRLQDTELNRFQKDYEALESDLLARDGRYNSGGPPVTEPMDGSII